MEKKKLKFGFQQKFQLTLYDYETINNGHRHNYNILDDWISIQNKMVILDKQTEKNEIKKWTNKDFFLFLPKKKSFIRSKQTDFVLIKNWEKKGEMKKNFEISSVLEYGTKQNKTEKNVIIVIDPKMVPPVKKKKKNIIAFCL